ncbi:uncharacterized protein [Nicotiana sylvestris]|uniref:uncharacterized protein n=1 Tax=Nicotiana sylvestris TaxID=4096 RepID=UPI00388C4A16
MANQELDASIINPSREVEKLYINSMKEKMYKLKQQMAEMYQAWAKGQPPPAYPANPAFIPPLAQSQDHPATDSSSSFPIYQHYHSTTSQTPPAPPPKQVSYHPPPVTLVFVAPPPTALYRFSRFKMPKFDLYDGHDDPVAHLRGFCSKMRGDGGKDELLMSYFNQSLSGSALEWYTRQDHRRWDDLAQAFACHFQYKLEIILDRLSLTKLEKKNNESFREYGFRWRDQATRVDPPIKESEMVDYFLQALEPTYYGHLVFGLIKHSRMRGCIRRKPSLRWENPIEPKLPNPPPRNLDHFVSCEYYFGAPRHDTEKYWQLKTTIQELVDTHRIEVQAPEAPNINQNPLSAHHETNMIKIVHRGGEPKKTSQTIMMIRSSEVRPTEKPTSEESVIKLKVTDSKPSVVVEKGSSNRVAVKQEKSKTVVPGVANKTIVVVEDEHHRDLMKILNEAHVPDKISVNNLEKIANKIFEVNRVTFSDDKLPVEGTEHNRAFYLTVKCEGSMVTRVLVDNGSSANICPLSTLNKLKVDDDRIHKNSICIQGFDGGGKDSVGDIVLELTIGPVEFTMEFQVLDMAISYNLLLG